MSDRLEAAPSVHRFNRYEIKYLVEERKLPELHAHLSERMDRDRHQSSATRVSSLYYDTRDLRFYWEKIEGLRFRRKLRIRVYGAPESINDRSESFVELKQRVNRVTQKRRIRLSYAEARVLCDERRDPGGPPERAAVVQEVLVLTQNLDLRPTAITTYFRAGYMGREADLGLRVTIDHRVSGRDRDFHLASDCPNQFIIPPHLAVVEVKVDERAPTWFTDLAARLELSTVRISKYCKAIEAATNGPRAPQHAREFPGHDAPTPAASELVEP
ncbi:VTC domain-containing protein [Nannocystis pusilla]|uniref:VTC domain-containing protein n=1 Tax=Nannocystis pusilla TaxID=889268 RepID=UPI003DA58FC7